MNHKDIQGLAMTGASLGKPNPHSKYYTYRKQAETVLTIPHTREIVNLEEKSYFHVFTLSVSLTPK